MTTMVTKTPEGAIVIDYQDLLRGADVSESIKEAFGFEDQALGVLLVRNLPEEYSALRTRLLRLASVFAALPEEVKEKTADTTSNYSFGWSCGKEIMNGKPDTLKGSYYNNPTIDVPSTPADLAAQFPETCNRNVWPHEDLPELEGAFKELGRFIVDVGKMVARACDEFVATKVPDYPSTYLQRIIADSQTHKARLLHYFPAEHDFEDANEAADSWCGWHCDHSSLTGLTSAMFTDEFATPDVYTEIPCPDPSAGLYIRNRGGSLVRVLIPRDALAFQTGEALQRATNGQLAATPHCVRGISKGGKGVARNTFAVFMQPPLTESVGGGMTFAEFSREIINSHYDIKN
ncbi:Clavaminate synthase-like protein [Endogone sp. FLAS-F59071]|nr:Clavaminate synthase-like protein [Endogone sp. FLAS-F59071]|eukprot:RUS18984.1 Clavaminate synthase-like protein [Endogone sp. FLAS-F59071]